MRTTGCKHEVASCGREIYTESEFLNANSGVVTTVSSVPLLAQCRQFEDCVEKRPPLSLESLLSQSKYLQLMKVPSVSTPTSATSSRFGGTPEEKRKHFSSFLKEGYFN